MHRKQLILLLILLLLVALSAFVTYAFFPEEVAASVGVPMPDMGVPDAVLGLASAGSALVMYGILGLVGYGFTRKLALPGIFSEDGN